MSEPAQPRFPPTMLGGPLPGEAERPVPVRPARRVRPVVPADPPDGVTLSLHRVWGRAARLLMRRPGMILGTTALVYLPYLAVRAEFWQRLAFVADMETGHDYWILVTATARFVAEYEALLFSVLIALLLVLPFVLQGALTSGVLHELDHTPTAWHESARAGLGRAWSVLGMALLVPLGLGACFAGLFFFFFALGRIFPSGLSDVSFGLALGVMLPNLLGPVYLLVPTVVAEGKGLWAARRRQIELCKLWRRGFWIGLRHAALVALPTLVGWGVAWVVIYQFGPRPGSPERPLALFLVGGLVTVCFAAFAAVSAVVVYAELRKVKGDRYVEEVSGVFE